MAIQQDIKRERGESDAPEGAPEDTSTSAPAEVVVPEASAPSEEPSPDESAEELEQEPEEPDEPVDAVAPTQLGARRFVYAAYFAGAIGVAFLGSKIIDFAWFKAQNWKPAIGEPRDEIVMPIAALVGVSVALYYWNRTRARELAEQVAAEMSNVTWPTRNEVTNGTFVVIVTTIVSTVFFALMDKFWGFVTNLVYGGS